MNLFTQAVISGLTSGTIYALLATGLIIAFRTTRVVNLAHGESYAIAGLVISASAGAGLPLYAAVPAGLLAALAFSIGVEALLLRPRADWPVSTLILVTLAAAFLSRGLLLLAFGTDPASFKRLFASPPIRIFGGIATPQALWLIAIGLAACIGTVQLLMRTRIGRQLQATAENPAAAQLLGVDVNRARLISFGIAGLLGGLSAVLLIPLVSVDYQAGLGMTLRGFIAASLSGMKPMNAVLGGLLLGLAEALVTTYVGALMQDPIVFLVLIGVAIWQSRHITYGGIQRA